MPEIKPGLVIWMGRFRNRAGIITKVFDDNGKLKYEVVPIPQGRKHPKVRNVLPFKPMNSDDTAKYRKMYDDEQKERKKKSAAIVGRYLNEVWASEDGQCRVFEDDGSFQSQFRLGSQWYDEGDTYHTLKDALRAVRLSMSGREK
jgi:phosphoketolase